MGAVAWRPSVRFDPVDDELAQLKRDRERYVLNLAKNAGRLDGWKVTELQLPAIDRHIARLEQLRNTTAAPDSDLDGQSVGGSRGGQA